MRNDTQIDPDTVFHSFDGVFSSLSNQSTAYREHSSLAQISQVDSAPSRADGDQSPPKKRWGLFRNMLPFSSPLSDGFKSEDGADMSGLMSGTATLVSTTANGEDVGGSPAQRKAKLAGKDTSAAQNGPKQDTSQHHHRAFKFSLEWVEKPGHAGKDRRLSPPRLPMPAQMFLQPKASRTCNTPNQEEPATRSTSEYSKYSGRALAEWALVVMECQNFFERRRAEGVPTDKLVETPTLGVETFRKVG